MAAMDDFIPAMICRLDLQSDGRPVNADVVGIIKARCGSTLEFHVAADCRDLATLTLWCNYPTRGRPYRRDRFYSVPGEPSDDFTGWKARLSITRPGPYEFFVRYRDHHWGKHLGVSSPQVINGVASTPTADTGGAMHTGPTGYFMVDPCLSLDDAPLPLSALSVQTMLTRCVGPLRNWRRSLRLASVSGYNMIHYTPVQELGESGSCYSIYDQNQLASSLFDDKTVATEPSKLEEAKILAMKAEVTHIEKECGGRVADNKVYSDSLYTTNSAWLVDHPEAGYNLDNSPHLTAAVELDSAMLEVSGEVAGGKFGAVSPHMCDGAAVDRVVDLLRDVFLPRRRLWEFYLIDVDAAVAEFAALYEAEDTFNVEDHAGSDNLRSLVESSLSNPSRGAERFPLKLDVEDIVPAFHVAVTRRGQSAVSLLRTLLEAINVGMRRRFDADVEAAINAIRNGAKHLWLDQRKGKLHLLPSRPLVWSYFTRLPEGHILANNGFIWNGDPAIDFTYPTDIARQATKVPWEQYMCQGGEILGAGGREIGRTATESVVHTVVREAAERPASPLCAASTPYFRREVIIWGDCVKLRYGRCPEDSPWLWAHMQRYVETMARVFHAFRLDNAHGTPIHVAQHMVDAARVIRPDLYLCAELFTGGLWTDVRYATKIGMNALVREAMQAGSAGRLAELIHSYGGHPIASLRSPSQAIQNCFPEPLPAMFCDCTHDNPTPYEKQHACNALPVAALVSASYCATGSVRGFDELVPHNPSVVSERRLYESLPLVSNIAHESRMLSSGIHTVRRLLNQLRLEAAQSDFSEIHVHHDRVHNGDIITIQRAHPVTRESLVYVCRTAFHAHEPEHDREALPPIRIEGLVTNVEVAARLTVPEQAVAEWALVDDAEDEKGSPARPSRPRGRGASASSASLGSSVESPPRHPGSAGVAAGAGVGAGAGEEPAAPPAASACDLLGPPADDLVLETKPAGRRVSRGGSFAAPDVITGLQSSLLVSADVYEELCSVELSEDRTVTTVRLVQGAFRPGSILVFRVCSPYFFCIPDAPNAHHLYIPPYLAPKRPLARTLSRRHSWPKLADPNSYAELVGALSSRSISLTDLSVLLFRSDPEEKDASGGRRGVYVVPGHGPLAWAGIAGLEFVLRTIRKRNLMGHALLDNLRKGDWLMDYTVDRLDDEPRLAAVQAWMRGCVDIIKTFPSGLKPQAFDRVVYTVFAAASRAVLQRMDLSSLGPLATSEFTQQLLLTSPALFANAPSAPLLEPPLLVQGVPGEAGLHAKPSDTEPVSAGPSLAAGHPHFATGFMRNWGRDTFIAFRGLLLVPGRFDEARTVILAYATVARHGLIPNLMDGGRNPRYNARDATWWFVQAVQDYCTMVPHGLEVLMWPVIRKYPSDDQRDYDSETGECVRSLRHSLLDVILEILQKHASGIDFCEWNAGGRLDAHMKPAGFRVKVSLQTETGFILGGSVDNCGTWMDKMGECEEFGTEGVPATPRDGAPVEITGLLYSCVAWLARLASDAKRLPKGLVVPSGVTLGKGGAGSELSFTDWASRIKTNFERCYYVPEVHDEEGSFELLKEYINLRGIYKDTYGGVQGWPDYQLRPNQVVAMVVATELFTPTRARTALRSVERLLGPGQMGIRTLDHTDMAYRGDYDNSSMADKAVARGWNYHQGPEWVWPVGYYLRARLRFPPICLGWWPLDAAASASPVSTSAGGGTTGGGTGAGAGVGEGAGAGAGGGTELCREASGSEAGSLLQQYLGACMRAHRHHLAEGTTGGLPELTNSYGKHCHDSCSVQAWSTSTLLDALCDLHYVHTKQCAYA